MSLAGIAARIREYPIAAIFEFGSVLVCLLLFAGTFVLLSTGAPTGRGDPWLALIGVGVAFVLFWTALVPLYERTL
ncbi:hypothetical protein [Natrinema sp. 1APR25-10V2]|uniref:hypothetical protein n=1 Tax=Natrinema sp. 1APR25-10V2 TaxID=2951081 RepID=UPI0028750E98|nr:hypothetical protein [Natrinema sp. 1APR25-10V2]MDS0476248.1 hypothetical protein [Natrinema sp. 1APR25-10V2]